MDKLQTYFWIFSTCRPSAEPNEYSVQSRFIGLGTFSFRELTKKMVKSPLSKNFQTKYNSVYIPYYFILFQAMRFISCTLKDKGAFRKSIVLFKQNFPFLHCTAVISNQLHVPHLRKERKVL